MKRTALRPYAGAALLVAPLLAHAQPAPAPAQLDSVTVTASRVAADTDKLPVAYDIITAQDIANSSARNVQELLSTQTGVHLLNSSGSSDRQTIDLRGFGMTGSSNTLVLIDGVRQNDNDLSAPSLGAVPLASIDRIEIIRGSGAVQYGGGATGGVINIITKTGFNAEHRVQLSHTMGSYDLRQTDASVALHNERVAFDAYGQVMRTDNYRDNNAERRDSGGASLAFRHDRGQIRGYVRTSSQKLELPGARGVPNAMGEDEYHNDRRGATTPDDYVRLRTDAFGLQAEQRIGTGTLYADLGQRDKRLYGLSFGSTVREQDLDESTASVRYRLPFNGGHSLVVGADWQRGVMDGEERSAWGNSAWRTSQTQRGIFGEVQIQATDTTTVTVGGRRQASDDRITVREGFMPESDQSHRLGAWQAGVRQELTANVSTYARIGRSFRIANADELTSLFGRDPLIPQTSVDKEIGVDWRSGATRARLSFFQSDLDNEIHFNALDGGGFGSNANLPPTRRRGIEIEGSHAFSDALSFNANATWLQARFREGTFAGVDLAGKTVPLVPTWMANASVTWRPISDLALNLGAQYVGKTRLDNDQANQFHARLPSYVLVNGRASYRITDNVEASFAVNNLFDRKYATYGVRAGSVGEAGRYNLYPAAERNVMATLAVRY